MYVCFVTKVCAPKGRNNPIYRNRNIKISEKTNIIAFSAALTSGKPAKDSGKTFFLTSLFEAETA
jgi:hypothetical protein